MTDPSQPGALRPSAAALPSAPARGRADGNRPLRLLLRAILVGLLFAASIVPALLNRFAEAPPPPGPASASAWSAAEQWYARKVPPVEELRPLAPFPSHWEGSWYDTDKNYARFEKWFADHLGLRNLMIRTKNEVDYRLFKSSKRVYFGSNGELFGRSLADKEMPLSEWALDSEAKREATYQGLLRLSARLQAEGITMVLMTPVEKQYFRRDLLPFFAPRVADDSHFMAFYQRLKTSPELHFVDVVALLKANEGKFPVFYRQDFHWTDPMAMQAAADAVRAIAELDGSPLRWRHRLEIDYQPFTGVETRFAARLNTAEHIIEPQLKPTWPVVHTRNTLDAAATGLEFDTGSVPGPAMLPPTCMYGNSFSDGMLRAGLPEHFEKFTKLSRAAELRNVPALAKGRCKYLILQLLDIQADRWVGLTQP